MYELPKEIVIDNKQYAIRDKGDFRMVLDCFKALDDDTLPENFRIITATIIFYECLNSIEDVVTVFGNEDNYTKAVEEMFNFFNCNQPNITNNQTACKLIDWEQDSQIICAAVNNVAQNEIRSMPFLHWFTFMGYYCSIGESVLATVVSIRNKIAKNKKLEKYEKDFKRENPQYFFKNYQNDKKFKDDELIKQIWNKDK